MFNIISAKRRTLNSELCLITSVVLTARLGVMTFISWKCFPTSVSDFTLSHL